MCIDFVWVCIQAFMLNCRLWNCPISLHWDIILKHCLPPVLNCITLINQINARKSLTFKIANIRRKHTYSSNPRSANTVLVGRLLLLTVFLLLGCVFSITPKKQTYGMLCLASAITTVHCLLHQLCTLSAGGFVSLTEPQQGHLFKTD